MSKPGDLIGFVCFLIGVPLVFPDILVGRSFLPGLGVGLLYASLGILVRGSRE